MPISKQKDNSQQARFPNGKPKQTVNWVKCKVMMEVCCSFRPLERRRHLANAPHEVRQCAYYRYVFSRAGACLKGQHPSIMTAHFKPIYTSALFSSYIFSIRSCTSLARVFFCSRSMLATSIGLPNSRTV